MTLVESSPSFWHSLIDLAESDTTFHLEYEFLTAGDGDPLGIWIDDQLKLILTGEVVGLGRRSTAVDVSDLAAGSHLLTVALHSTGDANAQVFVGNFQMIALVPEPDTTALLMSAVLCYLWRNRGFSIVAAAG
jgi:hypothetical protein